MKHTKLAAWVKGFLPLLAVLPLAVSCIDKDELETCTNKIICQNSPQHLGDDGTATLTFYCYWDWEANPKTNKSNGPCKEIPVTFTAVGGTCTASGETDGNGLVTCVFKASNPATFEGGTVTATMERYFRDGIGQVKTALSTTSAVGEILPRERPSKEKTKPRIRIVDVLEGGKKTGDEGRIIPLVSDEGKAKIVYVVDERTQGESVDRPVQGAEVLFQIANKTQQEIAELVKTITEKATTDEKGQAVCEVEVKDPSAFNGVELTAKTTVKYSDGEVTVEDKTEVGPVEMKNFTMTCLDSPQTIGTDDKATLTFELKGSAGNVTKPVAGATVSFAASKGSCTESATTDAEGKVQATFTAEDVFSFDETTVTATYNGNTTAEGTVKGLEWTYSLACTNTPQTTDDEGKATLAFALTAKATGSDTTMPVPNATVKFSATGGNCNPASGTTDKDGKVSATFQASNMATFEEGKITATYTNGNKSATAEGTVKAPEETYDEVVDLGLSVKWRGWNVGASKPWEYGDYYMWGEIVPASSYDWQHYKFCKDGDPTHGMTKYNSEDKLTVLSTSDDAASVQLGSGWRMPTYEEARELIDNCNWQQIELKGVVGQRVTGPNGNSIFLPATGWMDGTTLDSAGSKGGYWTATLWDDLNAWAMYFVSTGNNSRTNGFPIRPVKP